MKIVIPAAGQGTRLRPHTWSVPKVMLPVAGRPVLGHILADLAGLEPDEVRLVVGYMGEQCEAYVRETFPDLRLKVVWQQRQLGLGHAVLQALEADDQGPLLVVLGDTVFDVDYRTIVASPRSVLGVRRVPDPERFGIVELDAAGERVVRLIEKPADPPSDLALVGLYYVLAAERLRGALDGLVTGDVMTRGEYQLTDALQAMIDEGEWFVPHEIGDWFDCGKPETLLSTNRALLDRAGGNVDPADFDGARIVAPVTVGPDCVIENAVVGPHVSLSRGATVRDAIVRDSILADEALVEGAVLEGSILGPRSRVRGSAKQLNLGDGSEVTW